MFVAFDSFNNNKYIFTNNNDILLLNENETIEIVEKCKLTSKEMDFVTEPKDDPQLLIIELTTCCNFRCEYCVYSDNYIDKRNHGSDTISDTQIEWIIAYVKRHESIKFVTFYGGEPLLAYDKMKKIVDELEKIGFDGEYSLTTNGSLLSSDNISYFVRKGFHLLISYDGVNHSLYRKSLIENNAEKQLIEILQYIQEEYTDYYYQNIGFSITLVPPYNLKQNAEIFNNNCLFNRNQLLVSFVDNNTDWLVVSSRSQEEKVLAEEEYRELMFEYCYSPSKLPFHKALFDADMRKILTRKEPITNKIEMNGCCVPGSRRIYFSLSGDIYPCEKVNRFMSLGSWSDGNSISYDSDNICKKYYRIAENKCKDCWLANMCDSCFAQLDMYTRGKQNTYDIRCDDKKMHMKKMLTLFVSCLEFDEHALDYLLEDELV